ERQPCRDPRDRRDVRALRADAALSRRGRVEWRGDGRAGPKTDDARRVPRLGRRHRHALRADRRPCRGDGAAGAGAQRARRPRGGAARRRPGVAAGIARADRNDSFYIADIAVTCARFDPRAQAVADPMLIVEVLPPGTERHDRRIKLPAYRRIPSVEEILLIGSDGRYAELHRRDGARWVTEIYRAAEDTIALASVPAAIPLAELYDGIAFDDDLDG